MEREMIGLSMEREKIAMLKTSFITSQSRGEQDPYGAKATLVKEKTNMMTSPKRCPIWGRVPERESWCYALAVP
jgi:hypothetical protein